MWQNYEVSWVWATQGITFYYQGTELVKARNVEEAKQKALQNFEQRTGLSKSVITIKSVRMIA